MTPIIIETNQTLARSYYDIAAQLIRDAHYLKQLREYRQVIETCSFDLLAYHQEHGTFNLLLKKGFRKETLNLLESIVTRGFEETKILVQQRRLKRYQVEEEREITAVPRDYNLSLTSGDYLRPED